MTLYADNPGRVERAWAMVGVLVLLVAAFGLAGWLAWSHIHLAHGVGAFESGCSVSEGFDCDAVNTSDWGSLGGVPISLYAYPLYALMAVFAWVGRQDGERGSRARGGLVLLSGLAVSVSAYLLGVMVFEIGTLCAFCLTLDALHVGILALALVPPGGRFPALPAGLDMILGAFIAVVVMGTSFQFILIYAERLDRVAAAAIMEADATPQVAVATERKPGQVVALPDRAFDVPLDRYDPSVGPTNAKVTVVEFADFECGYCRRLSHNLAPLKERYGDRVRFVFKHYPMDQACNSRMKRQHHPDACLAARASVCAHAQRNFWAYHDVLFKNQKHLKRDDLIAHAASLGLDTDAFTSCMGSEESLQQVREDIAHGGSLELTGTPRTYVNGRMFKGAVSESMLEAAILMELGEAETTDDGRVRTSREVVTEAALEAGPAAMVRVETDASTFYIDAVEASIDTDGKAVPLAGTVPALASWSDAAKACAAAGKRMCTPAEWMSACQGKAAVDDDGDGSVVGDYLEGRPYPYGDHYRTGWCHDGGDRDKTSPVRAGSKGACKTPDGIYDLAGNLSEWVGATGDEAVLLGGAWYYGDKAACSTSYEKFGPDMTNRTTGFRCCADEAVQVGDLAPVAERADLVDAGEALPAFSAPGLDGDAIASDRIQGKVALINFWASWCTPCRKELPALAGLYERTSRDDLEILAVNVDRDPALARRFLARGSLPFPVLLDPDSEIVGQFDVTAMPTSILVDRSGNVVERHAGYSDGWFQQLEERIAELSAE